MAPATEDFALVVGIAGYPRYGPTPNDANDLKGPVHDAKEVASYLESAGVPKANITLLTSVGHNGAGWPPPPPRPIRADIESWLTSIVLKSIENVQAGNGPRIGRRLYIYMSGHGLAPEKSKRALVTADALSKTFIDHVLATVWHEHLSNSRYFDEYVLWMDCCTQAKVTLLPSLPPFEIKGALIPRAKQFVVCAAKFPLLAVELPLGPAGEYRGVFTYELLRGLKGAAANPATGEIRTKDLEGYLYAAMPQHIDKIPNAIDISREPDVLEDDDMQFGQLQSTTKERTITFIGNPLPGDGTQVTVSDHSRVKIATLVVANNRIIVPLGSGLYGIEWVGGKRLIDVADEVSIDA